MTKRFRNRTAIISGGGGDIGRAIAASFAREGANLALCDLYAAAEMRPFVRELSACDVQVAYSKVDVADFTAVDRWVETTQRRLGSPDLVIANAAIVTMEDLLQIEPERWAEELRVNLHGAFHLAQSGARRMVDAQIGGALVFVGSWAANAPHVDLPAYCVAKAGVRMLTQLFALRLAGLGIVVNEVAPGFVDAGLSGRAFAKDPQLKRDATSWVPVGRLISPGEVAAQVLHLCDPSNRHVTGSTLLMDGGLSLTNARHGSTTKD